MDLKDLKLAIAEQAKTAGVAPDSKSAYASTIMEIVQPNHLSLELFSAFMPVKQFKQGDVIAKRVRRGRYPIRQMVPNTKHLTDVLSFVDNQAYVFDRLIAGTSHNLWEIRSGEVGTVEQMRKELRADLFDDLVSRVFTLLSTVWNSSDTPNNFIDASSTGITKTALDAAIENMLEYSGQVRAIVGPRRALLPVYDFAQYKEFVLTGTSTDRAAFPTAAFTEFTNTMRVSTYHGIPIIELPQVYRNRLPANATSGSMRDPSQRMIPTDRVILVGDQAGEIALMDGTEYQDYTDPTTQPPNYVLHCWQAYGIIVDDVEQITVIKTNT
jgi:hypothetical protein